MIREDDQRDYKDDLLRRRQEKENQGDERDFKDDLLIRRQKKRNQRRDEVEGKPTYRDSEIYESD